MGTLFSHLAFAPPTPSYRPSDFELLDGHIPFFIITPEFFTDTVLIVAHGNGCDMGQTVSACESFGLWTDAAVASFEYPGYGPLASSWEGVLGHVHRNTLLSFAGAAANLRRAVSEVRARGYTRVFIVGWSIGSGPACEVAAEDDDLAGLILITPVYSIINIFCTPFGPLSHLDAVTNHLHMPNILVPVSIIHGNADRVVPFEHGERLHALAPNRGWFVELDGAGHNNIFCQPHIHLLGEFMSQETLPKFGS